MGKWSVKAILLTGANGFLGSHLLKRLADSYEIIITLRKTSNTNRIDELLKGSKNIYTYYIDEVKTQQIEDIFSNHPIETIIHCATNYGRTNNYFFEVFNDNVVFPMKLLEIGQSYQLKYFFNTDSYFNKEHLSYNALPHYSKTKKLFLHYLKEISKNITTINMRLEHIYGENDNPDKFITFLLKNIASHHDIDLTYGDQKRDFVYISDVVNAYKILLDNVSYFKTASALEFEIGTGSSFSIKEFTETLKATLQSTSTIRYGVLDYRDDEIMNSYAGSSFIDFINEHGLNFHFKSIYEGIPKMVEETL